MNLSSLPGWQALLSLLLALSVACAHVSPPNGRSAEKRVLVLEPIWVPEPTANSNAIAGAVFERWAELDNLQPVPFRGTFDPECVDQVDCLQKIGREASAEKVVIYRIGRLGPTTVIRVQALDVPAASMEQTLQRILEGDDSGAEQAVLSLTDELAGLYADPKPWYQKPWVWVAGAAALLAATLTIVLVSDGAEQEPDLVVTPP
ncbi:MAG: hypothetical protein AAFQ82_25985, partial [Myxococcota bacterium]